MPSRYERWVRLSPPSKKSTENANSPVIGLMAPLQSDLAVVVTHPWGPLGGSLHDPVVQACCLFFQQLGVTTVRFDFTGSQLFSRGHAQVQQVVDIADSLLSGSWSEAEENHHQQQSAHVKAKPSRILLVGYSYGSIIAASASAEIPACLGYISIAPPFGVAHWLVMFNANYHLERAAGRNSLPKLLVIGNQDNFTSEKVFYRTIKTHFSPETTTGAIVKDADHFFRRREKDLMNVIGQWLVTTYSQFLKDGDLTQLRNVRF